MPKAVNHGEDAPRRSLSRQIKSMDSSTGLLDKSAEQPQPVIRTSLQKQVSVVSLGESGQLPSSRLRVVFTAWMLILPWAHRRFMSICQDLGVRVHGGEEWDTTLELFQPTAPSCRGMYPSEACGRQVWKIRLRKKIAMEQEQESYSWLLCTRSVLLLERSLWVQANGSNSNA